MGAILNERFEGEPWIHQAQEAVKHGVQNCYDQLRNRGVETNAQPGDRYQHAARTRKELLATADEVADARQVNTTKRPEAPADTILPVDESQVRDPSTGVDDGDRTEPRDNDGPVPWLL